MRFGERDGDPVTSVCRVVGLSRNELIIFLIRFLNVSFFFFLVIPGRPALVGQHVDEKVDVAVLGRETGADDIVARGHALDAIAREIGVRHVGRKEDGLAGLECEVV